jgi:RNA polymerase sigma factor (sigma-70 family)
MTDTATPTVFIVDDDPAISGSLKFLIETVGLQVETFASAQAFLNRYDPERPGCLVLDVRMPGMSGLELQAKLREKKCETPVLILTGYGDVPMAVRAMKNGAADFLQKPVSDQTLLEQIQNAIAKDAARREERAEQRIIAARLERLTPREHEVMKLVVDGLSSREIGDRLSVSYKTIEAHRAKIMKKMRAESVPHLVRMTLVSTQHPS